MQTLPDSNYKTYKIPGYPENRGLLQASPMFSQGEDILIAFYLSVDNVPVTDENYDLELIIKKSPFAGNILWKGLLNSGLYRQQLNGWIPGYYYMLMPASASSLFLPGTYYLDVKAKEKLGTGKETRDLTFVVLSATFNIQLSAASPNPKLKASSVIESVFDPEDRTRTYTITSVEETMPDSTDITKI